MKASEAWQRLGISEAQLATYRMPVFEEAAQLIPAGLDMFDRPQQMTPGTHAAWQGMRTAAAADGIELQLVSAYRSIDYQCELIERKLAEGRSLEDVLGVNAVPGFSEHHSGQALDLATPGFEPLEEDFAASPAYHWLQARAGEFGFTESFPRDNAWGIIYEPWHWAFESRLAS